MLAQIDPLRSHRNEKFGRCGLSITACHMDQPDFARKQKGRLFEVRKRDGQAVEEV